MSKIGRHDEAFSPIFHVSVSRIFSVYKKEMESQIWKLELDFYAWQKLSSTNLTQLAEDIPKDTTT